jgi:uncharacterized membrane protein
MANPRSTASIAGHPIHPMLVPFPIALFVATLACDLAFWRTGDPYWATSSLWLLGAGLVMAALAAIVGIVDVAGEPRIRALRDLWWHAGGNVVMTVAIMLFTGWKGWQMVYRHHVGVADEPDPRAYRDPSVHSSHRLGD